MTSLGALIGANIRGERARRDWSQEYLGEILGTSQPIISAMERGTRAITVDDLLALCQALEVPAAILVRGAPPEARKALGF